MTNTTTSYEVNKTNQLERLGITLPKETLEQLGKERGDVPRSKFLFRAVIEYMSKKKTGNGMGGKMP
jgi:metal-responsive CopG/Arc/MetJ family transcriptional regulator